MTTVLHLFDQDGRKGGAYVAATSVAEALGQETYELSECSRAGKAVRTIGGYCDPVKRSEIRDLLRYAAPGVVHVHNFKSAGTAVLAACRDLRIPVVWSVYDYWSLCPRDNGHECDFLQMCVECYQPRDNDLPVLAKLPLTGRAERVDDWLHRAVDHVVCLSEHSKAFVEERHQLDVPHTVVPLPITVPAEIEAYAHGQNEVWPPRVVYLGGPHPAKGCETWARVKTLLHQHHPTWETVDVLTADREAALWEIAKATVVVFLDAWPNPGPIVPVEAHLLSTPCVTLDVGGVRETAGPMFNVNPDMGAAGVMAMIESAVDLGSSRSAQDMHREFQMKHDPEPIADRLWDIHQGVYEESLG